MHKAGCARNQWGGLHASCTCDQIRQAEHTEALDRHTEEMQRFYENMQAIDQSIAERDAHIAALTSENARLREALEAIKARSDNNLTHKSLIHRGITPYPNIDVNNYANAALKGGHP